MADNEEQLVAGRQPAGKSNCDTIFKFENKHQITHSNKKNSYDFVFYCCCCCVNSDFAF